MYKVYLRGVFIKEVETEEEIIELKREIYSKEREKIADKLDLLNTIKDLLKDCYGRRERDTAASYKKMVQTMHPEVIEILEKLISLDDRPIIDYWIHYPKMGELGFEIENKTSFFGNDILSLANYELELFMTLPNDHSFQIEEI